MRQLVNECDQERLTGRFIPNKWSVLEHIQHLNLTNAPYLDTVHAALRQDGGRQAGRVPGSAREFRGSWFGRFLANSQEPPPTRRLPTATKLKPAATLDADLVVDEFMSIQARIPDLLDEARDTDLDRVKIRSPVLPIVRLRASDAFALLECHTRRHIWLMREVLEAATS